jgi:RNA polymerase sigma-70 factor (ECF subfamily)
MTALPIESALHSFLLGPRGGRPGRASIIRRPQRAVTPRIALSNRSDELLLEDYRRGDLAAFDEIIDRYRNEMLHFLIRFLGSRAAAEDVFQETFLQVHLSADSFDVDRRFKPWVFTIAANKARDYHRKNHRRSTLSLSGGGDQDDRGGVIDLLDADLPSPDSPVLDSERSRLVKRVVDAMPAHLREILLLSYFQRLSYSQIADSLQIPLGTVKSRLHAAVAAFAKAWRAARVSDKGVS